jgi:hypothetical protein
MKVDPWGTNGSFQFVCQGKYQSVVARLARRGLPHPAQCLLCDQEEESMQHLLIVCVFARQLWFSLLHCVGLASLAPQPNDSSLDDWWVRAEKAVSGDARNGVKFPHHSWHVDYLEAPE